VKQAENAIIELLVETGSFVRLGQLVCPDSGRQCKGIELADV
jgi:hypothetical protein